MLLLVFGVTNLLGTAMSGPLADRAPRVGVLLLPGVLGVGVLIMLVTGGSIGGLFIAAAVWGFGFGGAPTTLMS